MKTRLTAVERSSRVILAAITGLLIWGMAINAETFAVEARLPLSVSVGSGMVLLSSSADSVTVRYSGRGWEMLMFQIGGLPGQITAECVTERSAAYPVPAEVPVLPAVADPDGPVNVEFVTPSYVTCTVDTSVTARAPVSPVFTDGIPARFRFTRVSPSLVTLNGPASSVSRADSVATNALEPSHVPRRASLASYGEMVAYSRDFVEVSAYDPKVPWVNSGSHGETLLTP
ncbi:MAG TPA: hypothetical protein PLM22_08980 [Candidatus Sabulitectum sp.]|nr:hypothetical protein [Candidatus Sabulitectum sp.]HPF32850.1 hypothetical protein [Candidatus Sabulitectum sp.]HPJ29052.1 hypothetical protein [Candidatus Sabulitectum sp.]HPR21610.1 hypothetical protein [Candidatus Sabulitectum sp.]